MKIKHDHLPLLKVIQNDYNTSALKFYFIFLSFLGFWVQLGLVSPTQGGPTKSALNMSFKTLVTTLIIEALWFIKGCVHLF